ncbi:hypothetical protein ACFSTC_09335 [Nonomuraea ferruginea]
MGDEIGERVLVDALHRAVVHPLAVAQHGDGVAQPADLAQPVTHEDDARAGLDAAADDGEQPAHLLRAERGGRLAEDEQASAADQRLGQRHGRLVGGGQLAHDGVQRDVQPPFLEQLRVRALAFLGA